MAKNIYNLLGNGEMRIMSNFYEDFSYTFVLLTKILDI